MVKKILIFIKMMTLCLLCCFAHAEERVLTSGIMMPKATAIQPFTLETEHVNQAGKKVIQALTQNNLTGHWSLLFFGFTNCPMLCPTTMANLANAYHALQEKNFKPLPQVIFISVDPQRDTLEKARVFATTFHPDFIGARTDDENVLARMTHDMHVMFEKVAVGTSQDKDSAAHYTIDHSGDIMVINPQGQLVATLTMPHTAENIVADYQTIVDHANKPVGLLAALKKIF
jgi:protein SCO1